MPLAVYSDKSEMRVLLDESNEVPILTPRGPGLADLEFSISDPFPGTSERKDAVSVSHKMHHLVAMLVKDIVDEC